MFGGGGDEDGEAAESSFGVSRLAEKQSVLQENAARSMDLEKASKLGREVAAEVSQELRKTGAVFLENIVPPFLRRYMNRKVYADMVEKVEQKNDKFLHEVSTAIRKQKSEHKQDKKMRKELKERNRQASVLATETNKELEAARIAKENAMKQDYIDRRDKQLADVQRSIDEHVAEMKAKIEAEVLAKRAYNLEHWSRQSQELHAEAVANQEAKILADKQQARASVEAAYEDWGERELTRAKTQVLASINSPQAGESRVGGLFASSPYGPRDNQLEDVGEVHLFDSYDTDARFENEVMDLQAVGAEEQRSRQLLDALQSQHVDYEDAVARMLSLLQGYERDSAQMNSEIQEMDLAFTGPPRRLPVPKELKPLHVRKERVAQLKRQMDELRYCISLAEKRKDVTRSQMQQLSAQLATLEEDSVPRQKALALENGGLGMMPVVIGRSIAKLDPKSSGLDILRAKPAETIQAITQQSKFVATRELAKYAMKTHRERNTLDQELWVNKQNSNATKIETNLVVSRLADIASRMKSAFLETMKLNLFDAINAFQKSGITLRSSLAKESGFMPWYNHMDEDASENVVCFTSLSIMGDLIFEIDQNFDGGANAATKAAGEDILSNGVTLGNARSGYCVGHIPMPKLALWNILLSCSVQNASTPASPVEDAYETVRIFIGSDTDSLTLVGTFDNKINPETGAVLYDATHPLRSDSVSYRFEFTSTVGGEGGHMCVAVGFYEQFEMKPLEYLPDPTGTSTRERVLSSFVKTLRIDEKQGKFREVQLLEELIALENSQAEFWDSDLVSHTAQRFSREYYLRILKVEILLQQKAGNAAIAIANEKRAKAKASRSRLLLSKKEEKVEESKMDFMARKRQRQSHVLEAGQRLVHTRIEIFDPAEGKWRHVIVKSCVVRWLDNGLTAKCTHILHEHNEGNELVGVEFEMDLTRVRWFEAAVQNVDELAMEKWRRQRNFERRLKELAGETEQQIYEMREAYDHFRRGEEAALRKEVHRVTSRLDKNVDKMAEKRASEPDAQRMIRQGVSSVLLEMKMGIVAVEPEKKPGIQALGISRERFIANWIVEKRRQTTRELLELESEVEARINARRLEFMGLETKVLTEANRERYSMLSEIREYRRQEKEKLIARVKFDPKVFEAALPRARVCAHLKTKAWGDKYAKGVRCVTCGKELSEIHKEESQVLGYGTATDPWMHAAIKRHRENEASFRFKNAGELRDVEEERLHLEKERRVMEEQEAFFYDLQDLSAVYDFDRRHAPFIKKAGIFRQGLQWTEEELRAFERQQIYKEKDRIKSENLVESVIDKFDPLSCIEEPPPTFRAADERRQAQYNEFMFMMGRLHTFQKKVALLKEQRLELLADRRIYAMVVEQLHKESYAFDSELNGIEEDLDRTGMLLSTYDRMQKLWQQATRILNQADKDRRKAEMRFCGVWEDVTEAKEKLSWVHDETRELLKIKFLYDSAMGNQHLILQQEKAMLSEKTVKMEAAMSEAFALEYCRPGDPISTRYGGYGWIRAFRKRDGMLFVTLTYAEPSAKMWTRAADWVTAERARQQGERYLMENEDQQSLVKQRAEKAAARKEQLNMAATELGLRDYYTFVDMGKRQDEVVKRGVDSAVQGHYAQLESAAFKKQQDKQLTRKVRLWFEREREAYEDYVGPAAGRPKQPTMWRQYKHRQQLNAELQMRFLAQAAVDAEKTTLTSFYRVRTQWLQTYAFQQLIDAAVVEWIKEIAAETLEEGKTAKRSSERMSGIAFPNPRTMQFTVYRSLVDMWKRRKAELRLRVDANKGFAAAVAKANNPAEMTAEEMLAAKAKRRLVRLEKRRQKALKDIMAAEEAMMRAFVKWELSQNLTERRLMGQEERETKAYLKALERARRAAQNAKVTANSNNSAVMAAAGLDERRNQLKELALERRRREEDQAFMIIEDKAGVTLREIDRVERQKQALAKALGEQVSAETELLGASSTAAAAATALNEMEVEIPEWMTSIPYDWDRWTLLRQRQHVAEQLDIRQRSLTIKKRIAVDEKKMDKLEHRGYDEWKSLHAVASVEAAELELTVMNLAEKTRSLEYELAELEANIRRVATFVRDKGQEELRMQSFVKKKEQYARKRERELKEATAWHELCIKRSRQRDKVKRRVAANCLWIDTDTITGFQQRFETFRLRERLYWMYFRRIAAQIICRAEIIASERKLFTIQEGLSRNKETLLERTLQMKERWKEIQRDDYMRMRKSLLNRKFFPLHRQEVLQQRFGSWVRFYLWNRGHREAFELRYEVLRTQMDLQRQFKAQLMPPGQPNKGTKPPPASSSSASTSATTTTIAQIEQGITPMQRHREHPVQCAVCKQFYLDSGNHSLACSYHPGALLMDCPRSCPSPGFTSLCQSHRIRRWKCCDSIKVDSSGCARRNHVPAETDALYEKIVGKVRQRDLDESLLLDGKLNDARKQNWPLTMMKEKRGQVTKIEENIQKKRDKADSFFQLKYA